MGPIESYVLRHLQAGPATAGELAEARWGDRSRGHLSSIRRALRELDAQVETGHVLRRRLHRRLSLDPAQTWRHFRELVAWLPGQDHPELASPVMAEVVQRLPELVGDGVEYPKLVEVFAYQLGANPETVRRAVRQLEMEGTLQMETERHGDRVHILRVYHAKLSHKDTISAPAQAAG